LLAEPRPRLPHLNETIFTSLAQARAVLATWRLDDNTARPHSGLGCRTPAAFAGRASREPHPMQHGLYS